MAPEIRNATKTVDKLQFKITYRCADGFIASTGGSESTFSCPCNGNWESVIADFKCEGMLAEIIPNVLARSPETAK